MSQSKVRLWQTALLILLAAAFEITPAQQSSTGPHSPVAAGTSKELAQNSTPADQKESKQFEQPSDGSDRFFGRPGPMVGEQFPSFEITGNEGPLFTSDSLRGAPALIEFWAVWCAPCVASLPEVAEFYDQTKCKGLVLIALDQDHVEGRASDFLAKRHYEWPDYHESDEVRYMLSPWAIPRTMLVDPSGKIVYDDDEFKPDELRALLGKMGPQFEGLAKDGSACQAVDGSNNQTRPDSPEQPD